MTLFLTAMLKQQHLHAIPGTCNVHSNTCRPHPAHAMCTATHAGHTRHMQCAQQHMQACDTRHMRCSQQHMQACDTRHKQCSQQHMQACDTRHKQCSQQHMHARDTRHKQCSQQHMHARDTSHDTGTNAMVCRAFNGKILLKLKVQIES